MNWVKIVGKFVFRLQSLLNVKLQIESSLKNDLGKAIHELEFQKELLRNIENDKEEYIGKIGKKSSEGICIAVLREYNIYILHLNDKTKMQKLNIKTAQKNVDTYREKIIKVMQEREMLEKLKEKKLELYLKEQFKDEQKLVDEIVSFNHK